MNRIRHFRNKRGLSQAALAELAGTTQPTIKRLESGEQQFDVEWMTRLGTALGVHPIDLLSIAIVAELRNDVEPCDTGADPSIHMVLEAKGLKTYRVLGTPVINLGFHPGKLIVIDTTKDAPEHLKTGDIVVAYAKSKDANGAGLIFRQFVAPGILTTNRPGRNVSINLDDEEIEIEIRGAVVPTN